MNTERFNGHTPGPWRAVLNETYGHMDVVMAEGDEKREAVLRLPCWACEEDMLELTAAAQLIAAAPDLKDALIKEREENKRLREDLLDYEPPEGFDWDDEHPRFSIQDWMESLAYGPARPGYWDWVNFQIVLEEDDEE